MKASFVGVVVLASVLTAVPALAEKPVESGQKRSHEAVWWSRGVVLERRATDGSWAVRWFDDLTVRGASKVYAGNEKDEPLVEITALRSEDDSIASRSITVSCLGNYEKRVIVAADVVDGDELKQVWMQQFRCGDSEWRVRTANAARLPSTDH
ncbi:hypothetical protein E1N52_22325 [Paraburkholderia guartelaensis]|uniref:Secreted protein n=1 Tax=Paraburkholderia guartelaensis TaxID=2546446 RepID=A0A4R5LA75_9BURK|nr:hypothetical protein [Paraburkholderia guartelaensis]TDG05978.1 hypothetical protein E1N52_22325 [Paraburkholderia guartelaensis]